MPVSKLNPFLETGFHYFAEAVYQIIVVSGTVFHDILQNRFPKSDQIGKWLSENSAPRFAISLQILKRSPHDIPTAVETYHYIWEPVPALKFRRRVPLFYTLNK